MNVEEDNYPLMSLRKLKRDYDADEKTNNDSEQLLHISADESSNEQQRVFHSNSRFFQFFFLLDLKIY